MNYENVQTAEEILEFMSLKKINCKFYLFDHNLNEEELTQHNKYLYETLDIKNFRNFPFNLNLFNLCNS